VEKKGKSTNKKIIIDLHIEKKRYSRDFKDKKDSKQGQRIYKTSSKKAIKSGYG
jgi:hypothetical protein